jgi:glycosyltransferase involved in cell wall biosynthesis
MSRPFVSVLTPTYNRRLFLPTAIECFKQQTYPMDRIEWIVLDDGTDPVGDLFTGLKNVRYIRVDEKQPIGAKRNRLNKEAKGEICVCMDDDDYYPPDRIRNCVTALMKSANRSIQVAGCSEILLYFTDRHEIWRIGPYFQSHSTNNALAYFRTYADSHVYDDKAVMAEEKSYLDDWKTPMSQMKPEDHIVCICHSTNTFDKRNLLLQTNPKLVKTELKLSKLIKNKKIRDFYMSLKDETAKAPIITPQHVSTVLSQSKAFAETQ